ncbi:hypothetical protein VitviT2T_017385 [Vitis vinifera]|uniref:DNA/RNA-binding domain-containing protein n=1 Tax=Vitis vinifera TaxID=29760 RepID=A0ABY9CUS3_VITVI|nr:hypothetical protein VitviT2T_017385 [Vitis vinifera]
MVGDEFFALYHCVRSLVVKEPFPDSWENLYLLLEKNRLSNPQAEFEDTEAASKNSQDPPMGFALIRSSAVHELKRVLVIDFDVHHGDGTNDDSMMAQIYSSFPLIKMEATLVLVKLTRTFWEWHQMPQWTAAVFSLD